MKLFNISRWRILAELDFQILLTSMNVEGVNDLLNLVSDEDADDEEKYGAKLAYSHTHN